MTVSELIEKIGRPRFTQATGYSPQIISRAMTENLMPSGWYPDVRALCEADGIDVPEHLFRWTNRRQVGAKRGAAA